MSEAPSAPASPPRPTIHEAERASGPSGAVLWSAKIDFAAAVARRKASEDVVIRGNDTDANRAVALAVESAVGPCKRAAPHKQSAGPLALSHFQQASPPPDGHTFY